MRSDDGVDAGHAARRPAGAGSRRIQLLLHLLVLRPLMKLVFGAGTEGRGRLRELDQFILVANHNSHLDLPLLFQLLPRDRIPDTHPLAAYEYFARSRPLFRIVERLFRPVWLARPGAEAAGTGVLGPAGSTAADVTVEAAMAAMERHLRAGASVVIFPEGTRGEPGRIGRFKRGVGRLAAAFPDVPVVPVLLSGPERALPKTAGVPLPLWTRAVVGEPVWPVRGTRPEPSDELAGRIAAGLERAVRGLAEHERARRQRRYAPRRPGPSVAVLGIDGSGKSTLSHALAGRLSEAGRVAVVSDELAFFDRGERSLLRPPLTEKLRRALSRRVKRAKSLKSYKVPKMLELLLRDRATRQVRRWYRPRAMVLDGCPALNMTAWARLYRDGVEDEACAAILRAVTGTGSSPARDDPLFQRFPELKHLVRLRLTPLERPDVVLFLDVPPPVAVDRIGSRGEARQVHETEEKLVRLRDGYLSVCRALESMGVPARVLDGDRSRAAITTEAVRTVRATLGDRLGALGDRPGAFGGAGPPADAHEDARV